MRTRPIQGTRDWSRQEIVLDVPNDAERLDFGVMLSATGEVSIKDVVIESFPPTTVSQLRGGWTLSGIRVDAYEIGEAIEHGIVASQYLRAVRETRDGNGRLMLATTADDVQGKRLRLSAEVRSDGVAEWAGLWMLAKATGPEILAASDMQKRPIRGTTGWRRYEILLDVPAGARNLAFGIQLKGPGQVWLRHVSVQAVSKSRVGR